ncbi:helix-turn-helix domain-containing protein [Christiangramia crocea]|uniref:AraC family transcriptional regulator n=1 Tax=Christiangramia crocea TaxID=2904124 RepID=A0A9X2A7L1_9FLAO|nr:AraC family transcriptional regulator [Gramella crocea]MCG9970908.1 AraC family transcriptional regulator [Gramella crocea]
MSTLLFPEVSGRLRLDHVEQEQQAPWLFNFFLALTALSGPAYFLLAFKLFKDFDFQVKNNFSSREDVNPDWLRKLVYSFGAVWTVLIIVAVIHHVFNLFSWKFCTDGLFLSLSVFVIMIGYLGLKQKEIFIDYPHKEIDYVTDADTGYSNVLFEDAEANMYLKKIQGYMEQEKPYLNAHLSLPDLASQLEIPSHHLSRVINERLKLNFFDFINQYRVEEVKTKIANPKFDNLSLLGIAFESGFNSKSAFNRIFKKMTGSTPSAYKRSITR